MAGRRLSGAGRGERQGNPLVPLGSPSLALRQRSGIARQAAARLRTGAAPGAPDTATATPGRHESLDELRTPTGAPGAADARSNTARGVTGDAFSVAAPASARSTATTVRDGPNPRGTPMYSPTRRRGPPTGLLRAGSASASRRHLGDADAARTSSPGAASAASGASRHSGPPNSGRRVFVTPGTTAVPPGSGVVLLQQRVGRRTAAAPVAAAAAPAALAAPAGAGRRTPAASGLMGLSLQPPASVAGSQMLQQDHDEAEGDTDDEVVAVDDAEAEGNRATGPATAGGNAAASAGAAAALRAAMAGGPMPMDPPAPRAGSGSGSGRGGGGGGDMSTPSMSQMFSTVAKLAEQVRFLQQTHLLAQPSRAGGQDASAGAKTTGGAGEAALSGAGGSAAAPGASRASGRAPALASSARVVGGGRTSEREDEHGWEQLEGDSVNSHSDDDDDVDAGEGLWRSFARAVRREGSRFSGTGHERRLDMPGVGAVGRVRFDNGQAAAAAREVAVPSLALTSPPGALRRTFVVAALSVALRPRDATAVSLNNATALSGAKPPKTGSAGARTLDALLTHEFGVVRLVDVVNIFFRFHAADGSNSTHCRLACRAFLAALEVAFGAHQPASPDDGMQRASRVATTTTHMAAVVKAEGSAEEAVRLVLEAAESTLNTCLLPSDASGQLRAHGSGTAAGAGAGTDAITAHVSELYTCVLQEADRTLQGHVMHAAADGAAVTSSSTTSSAARQRKTTQSTAAKKSTTSGAAAATSARGTRGARGGARDGGGAAGRPGRAHTQWCKAINEDIEDCVTANTKYGGKPLESTVVSSDASTKIFKALLPNTGAYPTFGHTAPAHVKGSFAKDVEPQVALDVLARAGFVEADDGLIRYVAFKHGIDSSRLASMVERARTAAAAPRE